MKLTVQLIAGVPHTVELNHGATVIQLKQNIEQLIKVPEMSQRLAVKKDGRNIILESGKNLSDYGDLSDGDTVYVLVTDQEPIEVLVKNHKGKIRPYSFCPNESVADFSGRVSHQEKIPQDQHYLVYKGQQLDESKQISDYNISKHSTVHQLLRLRGG